MSTGRFKKITKCNQPLSNILYIILRRRMSKHSSNEGPLVKNDSSERVSTESQSQLPTPSSNVFTSLIKK